MDYIFIKSKKKGNEEFGTVYARVRTKGINKKFGTGFTIRETEWLRYHTLQYVSSNLMSSIGIKYGQFASILAQIKTAFEDDFDPNIAPAVIRSIKSNILNGEELNIKESRKSKKTMLLLDYMDKYIEEMKTGVRFKKGTSQKVTPGYIKKLNCIRSRISRYEIVRRKTLSLDDVTMDFQRDYLKWYYDNNLSPNSVRSDLMNLAYIMKTAVESKLTTVEEFRSSQFVPKGEDVDHIYLLPEQITTMLETDLSSVDAIKELIEKSKLKEKVKNEYLKKITRFYARNMERTRDIFIVGCLSGQRFSDFIRICNDMVVTIDGKSFINLIQKKTKKKVIIPMDKRIGVILDKYNGSLPRTNIPSFNKMLKELAEIIGWTFKAKIDEKRMGSKTSTRFCDLISSHTARRSFATNAYAADVPLASIMAVTGHCSEKNLRAYLKLQAEEKAVIAAKDFENIIIT